MQKYNDSARQSIMFANADVNSALSDILSLIQSAVY